MAGQRNRGPAEFARSHRYKPHVKALRCEVVTFGRCRNLAVRLQERGGHFVAVCADHWVGPVLSRD
jgi:hypothetical protein